MSALSIQSEKHATRLASEDKKNVARNVCASKRVAKFHEFSKVTDGKKARVPYRQTL